jgi:asparagine synthase (glutamine-hydrolysing)
MDAGSGIALGHQRLAIVDLTAAGHQPMVSVSGRYVLAFNGEIYNHLEIRQTLGQQTWRGHSDTETLLAGIQQWGLETSLHRAVGMFAIAVWDREEKCLLLARDRMGEKPLYYGWQGKSFVFGSELKALREHPDFQNTIDRRALALYVRSGYVPAPHSIFSGIRKLMPGTTLKIRANQVVGHLPEPRAYWRLDRAIPQGDDQRFSGRPEEAVEALESHLRTAIKQQQIADVPLGAFLSGGVDSSTVVALMQALSQAPVRTFSIGFEEPGYNEAHHARIVAGHLKTEHTELYVTAQDAMSVIPELPQIYDEPFADVSQIPTVLVSRLARQHVTVALSGDGGDELFCGYGRYPQTAHTWGRLSKIPLLLRRTFQRMLPKGPLAEGLGAANLDGFYQFMNSQWKGFPGLVLGPARDTCPTLMPAWLNEPRERMMYADALTYLPDDILVKVDRAAMSTSLETRVPFLDHRVVEFAWSLPDSVKYRNDVGKWPLKQLLYKYVPQHMVDRQKMGFGVPLEHWLRGPLRDWAEDLLSEDRLRAEGFFDPEPIRAEWKRHLAAKQDRHYGLWTILMFQAWSAHLGLRHQLEIDNNSLSSTISRTI